MQYPLHRFIKKLLVFIVTVIVLHYLSWITVLANIGLLLLAISLTELIIWASYFLLPRELEDNLIDKAVLITGCDSGFGHNLAKNLDKKGVSVFAGCLFPEGEGALDLKNSCSSKLKVLHLDVTKDDHVQDSVDIVSKSLGDNKLYAIVNNAGVASIAEVEWCTIDEYQKIMEVNTFGMIRITKAFLPLLKKSQGRVVIVASYLGRQTIAGTSAYCMSKYAAISLADALRRELLKWPVSVHTIEPWLYSTSIVNRDTIYNLMEKLWNQHSSDTRDELGGDTYFKRFKRTIKLVLDMERPPSAISEVVDDMEHAVIGKNPKTRYNPGPLGHILLRASIPEELVDYFVYKFFPRSNRK